MSRTLLFHGFSVKGLSELAEVVRAQVLFRCVEVEPPLKTEHLYH